MVSDFKHDTLIDACSYPNTYIEYNKHSKDGRYEPQVPSTLQQSDLKPGEVFVIPNMRSIVFGDRQVNSELKIVSHILQRIGHGVLPSIQEPYRPVLLIDYLIANPKNIPNSSDVEMIFDLGSTFTCCKI